MDALERAAFPELPCLGGCERQVRAVELYGSVFPQFCEECRERVDAEEEAREKAEQVEKVMGGVRLGPKIKRWSLATFPAADGNGREALAAGRRWLEAYRAGDRRNLLIFGPVGTGKTGLGWGLIRELIEEDGVRCNGVVFRDLLDELRDGFRRRMQGDEVDYPIRRSTVLLLDDLGAERATDFAREELAVLVEHRWQRDLVTVATTNYRPAELAARLGHDDRVVGERIVSRLMEGAAQIELRGGDRRL